ncbi:MAG: hypothetical protein JWN95_44 [Frankiales bacterium]|nr:hypothetical protein [Frankiales bacterium]
MTFRDELRDVALDQHGYVTTRDAARLKIPPIELRKLASRGKLENVARGVYRFPDLPREHGDEYAAAVLTAGDDAYLTGLSVLALHELAQVNPRTIDVGTDKRVRLARPGAIRVIRQNVPASDRTVYVGIPSVTVARAIKDAIQTVMSTRLVQAAGDARARGLLTRSEHTEIVEKLNAAAPQIEELSGSVR